MRRKIAALSAIALLCCACSRAVPEGEFPSPNNSAAEAIVAQLAAFDDRVYVYRNNADGWNQFTQRSWIGSHGIKPNDMEQNYQDDAVSGSAIRCTMDFTKQDWGGYQCLNGALGPGDSEPVCTNGEVDARMDLTGATSLTVWAKGRDGGERVEFFCAGLGYSEYGPSEPFADTSPRVTMGTVTLTAEWKRYTLDLTGSDMSRIGNGFGWVATSEENKNRNIEFYLDEIYFTVPMERASQAMLASYYSPLPDSENQIIDNFAYLNDNALACVTLAKTGYGKQACQIADAIAYAVEHDRSYSDGRLRNGYLCGTVASYPGWISGRGLSYAQIPGFFLPETQRWHEDFYVVSTDAGSMAWAILALCAAHEYDQEQGYLDAARRVADFTLTLEDAAGGFVSGYQGWEGQEQRSTERNTQFNFELSAAFAKMAELTGSDSYSRAASHAMEFAVSQYDAARGCFVPGVNMQVDGGSDLVLLSNNTLAAMALPEELDDMRQSALAFVQAEMACGGGFSCSSADASGVWFDGTAQMAVALQHAGQEYAASTLLAYLEDNRGEDGSLYSASINQLPSGRVNPGDNRPILFYRRLHLGSTAWLSLAQEGLNPLQ